MNVELLEKVKKHILAEPKRINMNNWCYKKPKSRGGPACGTVGCIAGWTVLLSHPKKEWSHWTEVGKNKFDHHVQSEAIRLLGITVDQSNYLFCAWGITGRPHTKPYAKKVASRIDALIEAHRVMRKS
jgi:hypothetical protein